MARVKTRSSDKKSAIMKAVKKAPTRASKQSSKPKKTNKSSSPKSARALRSTKATSAKLTKLFGKKNPKTTKKSKGSAKSKSLLTKADRKLNVVLNQVKKNTPEWVLKYALPAGIVAAGSVLTRQVVLNLL